MLTSSLFYKKFFLIDFHSKAHITGSLQIDRNIACYITQQDNYRSGLTLEELMHLACNLKLNESKARKLERIDDILVQMKLNEQRRNTASDLSGGERKRFSVALELVSRPQIFFLDEPTSGLDEISAQQCVSLLRKLAERGRTVVCTIHQTSTKMLSNFDSVYIMTKGQCLYQGKPQALVQFLSQCGFEYPKSYSPTDYGKQRNLFGEFEVVFKDKLVIWFGNLKNFLFSSGNL